MRRLRDIATAVSWGLALILIGLWMSGYQSYHGHAPMTPGWELMQARGGVRIEHWSEGEVRRRGGATSLLIPYWLTLPLLALPYLQVRRAAVATRNDWLRAQREQVADQCPTCGYDLRATPSRCPECGTTDLLEVRVRKEQTRLMLRLAGWGAVSMAVALAWGAIRTACELAWTVHHAVADDGPHEVRLMLHVTFHFCIMLACVVVALRLLRFARSPRRL